MMQISNTTTGKESETPFRSNAHQTAHTTTPPEICDFSQGANLLLELKKFPAPYMKKKGRGGGNQR